MVTLRRGKKAGIIIILLCLFSLLSCTVDLPGIFGSTDLDKRLEAKNDFPSSYPWNRTLSLGDEFSFIVLTDTHILDGDAFGLEKIEGVIDASIAKGGIDEIKFVAICGDITQYCNMKDIDRFIEIVNDWTVPCYPVIGNHDVYQGNWPNWKKKIGSTRYRVDGGGATLFILDSATGYFGKEQLDWLEKEVKTATGRVFTFSHSDLFTKSPLEQQQFTDTRERARFLSILEDRCDIMFWGHTHRRNEEKIGGIQYITIEDFRSKDIYCIVKVTKDGISWEFKKI